MYKRQLFTCTVVFLVWFTPITILTKSLVSVFLVLAAIYLLWKSRSYSRGRIAVPIDQLVMGWVSIIDGFPALFLILIPVSYTHLDVYKRQGEDYLFTFKSIYNPYVNADSWKTFTDFISEIVIDPNDPKKVAVYFDSTYILDFEAATNWNLYPAHIYDPENIMSKFTLEELRATDKVWTAEQDSLLKRFATLYELSLIHI